MSDISKIDINRIDGLENQLSSISNKLNELESLLTNKINVLENKLTDKNYVLQYPTLKTEGRITVPANTDYTLTENNWVWWGNTSYVGRRYFYVNGIEIGHSYGSSGNWEEFNSLLIPLKKDDVIRHTGSNSICYIYPN